MMDIEPVPPIDDDKHDSIPRLVGGSIPAKRPSIEAAPADRLGGPPNSATEARDSAGK